MKKQTTDYLLLKWGTIKAFDFTNSPEAFELYQRYCELDDLPFVDSINTDTSEQKELLCQMIDNVNGSVIIYWENIDCTNDRQIAKDYVMKYRDEEPR